MPFGNIILLFYMQLKYSDNCFSKFDALLSNLLSFKLKKKCRPICSAIQHLSHALTPIRDWNALSGSLISSAEIAYLISVLLNSLLL